MKKYIFFLSLFYFTSIIKSQNNNDANFALEFFKNQEYDKAEILLKKLYTTNKSYYFNYLFKCYYNLRKYNDCNNLILDKYEQKSFEFNYFQSQVYFKTKDSINYKKSIFYNINLIEKSDQKFLSLYEILKQNKDFENQILLLEKIYSIDSNNFSYHNDLIDLYINNNKFFNANKLIKSKYAIDNNLNSIIFSIISIHSENKNFLESLEKSIYTEISKNPSNKNWNEFAMWISILLKNYDDALDIAIAQNKLNNENGNKIYNIGIESKNEKEYDISLKAFKYIINKNLSIYISEAYYHYFNINYSQQKINNDSLYIEFKNYFLKYGYNKDNYNSALLYSEFLLKNIKIIDSSIAILDSCIYYNQKNNFIINKCKLQKADYLLIKGDIWESNLLYGQIEKSEKNSPLGEEARFKFAKLFYFTKNFELSKDLLNIVKQATNQLLSNDALYLSVFIEENIFDDSVDMGLNYVSQAELLFIQNKDSLALKYLDSAIYNSKNQLIIDDIIMIKALYYLSNKNYNISNQYLDSLITNHPSSVLLDKALYTLATNQLLYTNQKEKAMDNFLILINKFKDSVYSTDARLKYRTLRNDKIDF